MAHKISSLKELEIIIMDAILETINDSESKPRKFIQEIIMQTTIEMVYDRYEPKKYVRRKTNGGLMSLPELEYTERTGSKNGALGTASFTQTAKGNFPVDSKYYTDDLASTINEGWGEKTQPYTKPSGHLDALEITFADGTLEGMQLVEAIISELQWRGWQIE